MPIMRHGVLAFAMFLLLAPAGRAAEPPKAWQFAPESLRPFWRSDTMHGESVLFLQEAPGGTPRASLLMPPKRILELRSPDGATAYREGRDYVWKPGERQITLPPGSQIAFYKPADLRRPAKSQPYALTHRDGNGEIRFGAGHEYHDMQVTVTYQFDPAAWTGPRPSFAEKQLPRAIERLRAKQPLTIALLGDSISTGCNASGWAGAAPFQPPYQDLLVRCLEAHYKAPVTLKNFAVGGTDTGWGLANLDKVIQAEPHLVILAFGMNDSAGRPAADYQANIRQMIDRVQKARPEAEFILIASMLGNRDWVTLHHDLFPQYRDALAALCRPGVVMADMTMLWDELLKHKKDADLTGNGVNHPNDFGHRLYAQTLSALLMP